MGSLARRARKRGTASSSSELRESRRAEGAGRNGDFARTVILTPRGVAVQCGPVELLDLVKSKENPYRIFEEADREMTVLALGAHPKPMVLNPPIDEEAASK